MSALNVIGNTVNSIGEVRGIQTQFTLTTNANTNTVQAINFQKSGTQSLNVHWGDGEITTGLNHSHTYVTGGVKNVVVTCDDINTITSIESQSGMWDFDVSALPKSLLSLTMRGSNAIKGSVFDLPRTLTYLRVEGGNILDGDITGLPSSLAYCTITGNTTINGYISNVPSGVTSLYFRGVNNVHFDSLFNNTFTLFICFRNSGSGWTSTEVDNFLSDLNTSISANSRTGTANIAGTNAARTSASDADVTAIQSAGWTLTVNE